MTYDQVKYLKPSQFKRLCGVKPETFERMVEVVNQTDQQIKPGRGRPSNQHLSMSATTKTHLVNRFISNKRLALQARYHCR